MGSGIPNRVQCDQSVGDGGALGGVIPAFGAFEDEPVVFGNAGGIGPGRRIGWPGSVFPCRSTIVMHIVEP